MALRTCIMGPSAPLEQPCTSAAQSRTSRRRDKAPTPDHMAAVDSTTMAAHARTRFLACLPAFAAAATGAAATGAAAAASLP